MGRQPPGSRLHGHLCRLRGRAATPRADAHRLAVEPAVGRQPPGSRLHGHPCRLRGGVATPRADAHRLAGQPWGVSPRGHGCTPTPAGFAPGVAPQPRGLTPIGWPSSQPWGVSPRGHGCTATPAGFGVVSQPRGLTPIGCPASRGASAPGVTAARPPLPASGSRRGRGGRAAVTPGADAPRLAGQPMGVSPRGCDTTPNPAGVVVQP